ncbi:EF-hand domain-containing protein [uncultured Winogradskyella sp.]|uniref:EF-hand domain-containing protein n=1 Tax=uncultured Winogradskyella sp. TaxID=395353 RepID=UPI0026341F8C|nr:EF-hand domain-containing protein [uncultured Winogradskyella sp.]
MISKTLKASIFIIAVASFSFAGAQEKLEVKKDKSEKMFKHLDANADDIITLEEFKAKRMKDPSKETQVEKRFASMDTDKNGTVDKAEFKVFFETPRSLKQTKKAEKVKVKKG